VGDLYSLVRTHLIAGVQSSERLGHPILQAIWLEILELSGQVQRKGAHYVIPLPPGYSA